MFFELFQGRGVEIFCRAQAKLLGCQVAYRLAVHGVVDSTGARNDLYALLLKVEQTFCTNSLDFRYDDVGTMFVYYLCKSVAIKHVKHLMLVCHLHGRSVLVSVACHDILSCTLCGDDKFFAQLART